MVQRLSRLGEKRVTRLLVESLIAPSWPCRRIGPGDDAYCVPGLENVVVSIDGYAVENALLPWMSLRDLGWKAVVAALSDVVAKAARPRAVAVSVGLRGSRTVSELEDLVRGAAEAAQHHGAFLVGGDTNSAPSTEWIDVAVVGIARRDPVGFSPSVGDTVYTTTGRYGLTYAAYRLMERGLTPPKAVLEATRRPMARLEFVELAEALGDCVTAARDVSDGLAYTLYAFAEAARATVVVESLPLTGDAEEIVKGMGLDPVEASFNGGEEYEVVFTVRRGCENRVESEAERLGVAIAKLGRLVAGPPAVSYGGRTVEVRAWDQFKGFMAVAIGGGPSSP